MDSDDEDDDEDRQAAERAVARNAGGTGAGGGMDADDDGAAASAFGQGVAFEKGAVTLEQVRRRPCARFTDLALGHSLTPSLFAPLPPPPSLGGAGNRHGG